MTTEQKTSTGLAHVVAEQHAQIGVRQDKAAQHFARNPHPDAQWFESAGLGLFVHWGISSVDGEGDISWSMMSRPAGTPKDTLTRYGFAAVQKSYTPADYWAQAERFSAENYDPTKWLAAAKAAGATYAVLTTRHHDGYSLWPSAYGELGTRTHLAGRDLVGPFVEACRKNGLKVGLYYSPPDWHVNRNDMSFRYGNGLPALGMNHEPIELPVPSAEDKEARAARSRRHIRGQVEELLTRYGKIDLIWFDGNGEDAITIERIRELQPGIVFNERAHGHGDFATWECRFPKEKPAGWWEYCHVWSDGGWAYLNHEIYKPMGWFLAELVRTRSWSGNFLPSAGPNSRGELPEAYYRRFEQLAAWMAHSGVSVQNVTSGPWPERSNVPVTCKGNVWYAHFDWVQDEPAVIRGVARPVSVRLLRDGTSLPIQWENEVLTIILPSGLRTTLLDVAEIRWSSV